MPDSDVTNLQLLGYAFATVAYTAFAITLLRKGHLHIFQNTRKVAISFTCAVAVSAVWAGIAFAALLSAEKSLTLAATLIDATRYGLWFFFLLFVLSFDKANPEGRRSGPLRTAAILLVLLGFSLPLWSAFSATPMDRRWILFGTLVLPLFGLMLVEQLFRSLSDDSRWSAKPLCFGLLIVFGFDFYFYSQAILFGHFDPATVSVRGGLHALAVPFLAVAVGRRSDWAGKLKLSRTAAFHSLALLLAGAYLLFISAIGYYVRYTGGDWGQGLQVGLLFVALVGLLILASSGTMRSRLRVLIGKHFFSYRYDYRVEWLRFTSMLASRSSPQEMGGSVIRGLADLVESPGGSLWLKDRRGDSFVQTTRWNMPAGTAQEPANGPFAGFLAQRGWIVKTTEYRAHPERYEGVPMPAWLLSKPDIWLVIPLLAADELIGFVTLVMPRAAVDVNWEVTDLLKTASRQAASFLAQMHATEALLEARKFEAFNRMSAFVVHDLKNIVTQLSLMLKNAQRLKHNPEFQQDMLLTVESSLDKMRQMILQLREGEAPASRAAGVDLLPIAHRLEAAAADRGRSLELRIVAPVATRGHEGRIERVLGHVVQNALDATPTSGSVWLKLEREGGQAKVEVGDTGAGMSAEFVQQRLFKPFQTSKEHGMGIGAYESFQYVQELGGKLSVDSHVGRGTVVTILLPLFDLRQDSDIHALSST